MIKVQSVTIVLILISCFVASNKSDHVWIIQSNIPAEELPPNLTTETSHQLLLKQLSKNAAPQLMFELRNEFYTMAAGKDFYRLIADENENKQMHAIAESTLQLWQKLPYMGIMSSVIRTAIANGAYAAHAQHDITKAWPVIKENIEKLMKDPPAPYDEYKRLKNEALAKPLPADYSVYYYEIPKTKDDALKIVAKSLNDPYLKKVMVHATLGNETRKQSATTEERFLLAKSALELSKNVELGGKVQALYDEAVDETAKKIEDVDYKSVTEKHVRDTFIRITDEFFKTLASKFESDPVIKTKVIETKEAVKSQ